MHRVVVTIKAKGLEYAKSIGGKRYFEDFCDIEERILGRGE